MKVSLAVQVFSDGVANALTYCNESLKLPQFKGCEATVSFLKHVNGAFDVLNSRNHLASGSKSPLKKENFERSIQILNDCKDFLLGLKDAAGVLMHKGPRKTGFLGLIYSMHSFINLHKKLVLSEEEPLNQLLGYKFSQDHLELFFSAVRARGGFNNNPTARQFKAAFKRLLVRHHIQHNEGNCSFLEEVSILHVNGVGVSTVDLRGSVSVEDDTDFSALPDIGEVSEYKQAVINYICGFIVRQGL